MYEVFMTAFLNDVDFHTARSLLSGYCDDQPHPRVYRVLTFAGNNPNHPKGLPKRTNIHGIPPEPDIFSLGLPGAEPAPDPSTRYLDPSWNELNDVLKKQSFIVSARYEVPKNTHFGSAEPITPNFFNETPGALFWSQVPEPPSVAGGQSLIMQRRKIEIHDQLNLPIVLAENDFSFKSEYVEETHDFYHREAPVEFHLVRQFRLAPNPAGREPSPSLPPFGDLQRVDPAGKWILWAVSYVLDDQSSPEKTKAARDALTKVHDELGGAGVPFRAVDRRHHDTSIAAARQPATQTLGNTQQADGAHDDDERVDTTAELPTTDCVVGEYPYDSSAQYGLSPNWSDSIDNDRSDPAEGEGAVQVEEDDAGADHEGAAAGAGVSTSGAEERTCLVGATAPDDMGANADDADAPRASRGGTQENAVAQGDNPDEIRSDTSITVAATPASDAREANPVINVPDTAAED